MLRKYVLIVVGITLAICAATLYFVLQNKPATAPSTSTSQTAPTNSTQPKNENAPRAEEAGAYVNYNQDVLKLTGTKILFFHAAWCPQCRQLEADIKANKIPSGVTIIKVDYDSNQSLRQKYGVTLQTTLVRIDDSGNLVKKFVAYNDPSLQAIIKNLL